MGKEADQRPNISSVASDSESFEIQADTALTRRTVTFPGRRSLGELYILDERDKAKLLGEASGSMEVPADARLVLYYSLDPVQGLCLLAELDPLDLYGISFLGNEIHDDDLGHIGHLTGLKEIDVSCTQVGDAGLTHLKDLKNLHKLNLSSTKVNNAGISSLARLMKMKELILDNTEVGDEGLAHISPLESLTILSLSFSAVTNKGLSKIKHLKNLQVLRLNCTKITEESVVFLAHLTGLKELWLRGARVSNPGLVELTKWLPSCEIII